MKCGNCNSEFTKKSKIHKYCSNNCRKKYYFEKYHEFNKDNKKVIECYKCGKNFETHIKNKKFCSNKCKLRANNHKIRERVWVRNNYKNILKNLPRLCKCGIEANEVHHKTYNIPIRKISKRNIMYEEAIKEYCKYLTHLCTECHRKIHK